MDADYCVALDEAENRLHVQKAVMMTLLGFGGAELVGVSLAHEIVSQNGLSRARLSLTTKRYTQEAATRPKKRNRDRDQDMNKKIVLAFSGGLDTSYCVLELVEQGFEVHTAFVDTGGVRMTGTGRLAIRARSR